VPVVTAVELLPVEQEAALVVTVTSWPDRGDAFPPPGARIRKRKPDARLVAVLYFSAMTVLSAVLSWGDWGVSIASRMYLFAGSPGFSRLRIPDRATNAMDPMTTIRAMSM